MTKKSPIRGFVVLVLTILFMCSAPEQGVFMFDEAPDFYQEGFKNLFHSSNVASETLKIQLNQTIMLEPHCVANKHYYPLSKVTSHKMLNISFSYLGW